MSDLKLQTSVSAISNKDIKSNKVNKLAAFKAVKDLFMIPLVLVLYLTKYTIGLPLSALFLKDRNHRENAACFWGLLTFIGGIITLIDCGMPIDKRFSYDISFKLFAAYWLIPLMVFIFYVIKDYIVERYNFYKES